MSSEKISWWAPGASTPDTSGTSERPWSHGGGSIPATSQIVGKMSIWETSSSWAMPPRNPAPRMISITPMPRSSRLALAVGKARPWSVVQITSVLRSSPVSCSVFRTAPTPWSSERALAL